MQHASHTHTQTCFSNVSHARLSKTDFVFDRHGSVSSATCLRRAGRCPPCSRLIFCPKPSATCSASTAWKWLERWTLPLSRKLNIVLQDGCLTDLAALLICVQWPQTEGMLWDVIKHQVFFFFSICKLMFSFCIHFMVEGGITDGHKILFVMWEFWVINLNNRASWSNLCHRSGFSPSHNNIAGSFWHSRKCFMAIQFELQFHLLISHPN